MDVLEMANPIEQYFCQKATITKTPIGATFELSPLCNMDCRMCYVRMSPEELSKQGRLRTAEEWLNYAEHARSAGLLFLLLTGGEPFLYPEFEKLYTELHKMGLVLSINTNGTMLNREKVQWLAKQPPRKLNITIYGGSDETYQKLCGNPRGFTQLMNALELCREYGIAVKLNYTVTRENVGDLQNVFSIAKRMDLPITVAYYVFPANRRTVDNGASRLTPAEAAEVRIAAERYELGEEHFREKCRVLLDLEAGKIEMEKPPHDTAFTCRAGSSTYWINWRGEVLLCGMTDAVRFDLDHLGFPACWEKLKEAAQEISCPEKCADCRHETACARCAAASIAETSCYEGTPEYLCELYECYLSRLREIVKEKETEER